MEKKLISIGMALVMLAVLLGMIASVQSQGVPFSIYGQVFDTDGTTPVDGVTVTVTNLETGSSVAPNVTASGGWYSVNIGNLQPNPAHSEGDDIQIVADDGLCKSNTIIVQRVAKSPQQADVTLEGDVTAPEITDLKPADGACTKDSMPEICANYSDAHEIDTASVTIIVDATNVTADATVTEDGVCYTPSSDLAEGEHMVTVNASDLCGNSNSISWAINVDTIPPAIDFIQPPTPANNSEITVNYLTITANVTDFGCGIDNVSLIWNGGIWTEAEAGFRMFRTADEQNSYDIRNLLNGDYTYWIEATDIAGNTGLSETRIVTVNASAVIASVTLASGFNIISVPVNDTAVTTASSLGSKIGPNCSEVVKWNSATQAYVSHIVGLPLNDFAIEGGEGYFVNVNKPTLVAFTGLGWYSPFTLSLASNFNIIGMPVNDTSVTSASSLATKIGVNCAEVVRWNSATQAYVSHIVGLPLNDFAIEGGEGYFVNMVNPTEVTFEGTWWQD